MHFKFSKSAQKFFSNIMPSGGSHGTKGKNKFEIQFDVYYCCAMIGMAAIELDEDTTDLTDLIEGYPKPYMDCKAQIAGLLVATEAKRQDIDMKGDGLEKMMLHYLSDNETMLSEEGVKTLNAYALRGFQLIQEYPLGQKPMSREEFLEAFHRAIQMYKRESLEW